MTATEMDRGTPTGKLYDLLHDTGVDEAAGGEERCPPLSHAKAGLAILRKQKAVAMQPPAASPPNAPSRQAACAWACAYASNYLALLATHFSHYPLLTTHCTACS